MATSDTIATSLMILDTVRLTRKVKGKTVTETFPSAAVMKKAERELAEFHRVQQLSGDVVQLNEQICRLRPISEEEPSGQEKTRSRRSSKRSPTAALLPPQSTLRGLLGISVTGGLTIYIVVAHPWRQCLGQQENSRPSDPSAEQPGLESSCESRTILQHGIDEAVSSKTSSSGAPMRWQLRQPSSSAGNFPFTESNAQSGVAIPVDQITE